MAVNISALNHWQDEKIGLKISTSVSVYFCLNRLRFSSAEAVDDIQASSKMPPGWHSWDHSFYFPPLITQTSEPIAFCLILFDIVRIPQHFLLGYEVYGRMFLWSEWPSANTFNTEMLIFLISGCAGIKILIADSWQCSQVKELSFLLLF